MVAQVQSAEKNGDANLEPYTRQKHLSKKGPINQET